MLPATVASSAPPSRTGPTSAAPRYTLAIPQTTIPIPICTSANPCTWATSAPESATSALAIASPATVSRLVLRPSARAIVGVSPPARIAVPRLVRKKR